MTDDLLAPIRIIVDLLVRREYETVEAMTRGSRLSAREMEWAITQYGRTLTNPPVDAWSSLDVVQINGSMPPAFHVVVPLWTAEEGCSDLSVELQLTEIDEGLHETTLLDIRTL
jgi:hypothetical protein